jgi:CxxC motif-containing protein
MKEINMVIVDKRLSPGDIVIENINGTDVNLLATDDMKSLSNINN